MTEVTQQQQPEEPELSPLPPIPDSLRDFWLCSLPKAIVGKEQEPRVYSALTKATEAIQAEISAAKNVQRAATPEQIPLVALHNKLANLEVAAGRLTEAAELWREVGDRILQALYESGLDLDAEGLAYAARARRALCLRQAVSLMAILLEIDRKRLEDTGHQPMVFL